MPSTYLVGTAPDQVPTNADLGEMAFQSKDNVNFSDGRGGLRHLDVTAISAQLNVSATDVFVYDTSKDSDGGAWRKRCQHTSWYNETLNTATRGSRREFPAVAVIVATTSSVTIYDGDDPLLPMWMVFTAVSTGIAGTSMIQIPGNPRFVCMLNATLVEGVQNENGNYGNPIINFISEKVVRADSQASGGEGGRWLGNIADRNSSVGYVSSTDDYAIVASQVNDVAMTVLPNAPIDAATGLPIPTIAFATNSGVSLIRHNGTVSNVSAPSWGPAPYGAMRVMFSGDYIIFIGQEYAYYQGDWYVDRIDTFGRFSDTGAYDSAQNQISTAGDGSSSASFQLGALGYQAGALYAFAHASGGGHWYYGRGFDNPQYGGLYGMLPNFTNMPSSMVFHAGRGFNTGWMVGSIRGAWLNDTTQETLVASNILTNGDFSSSGGWSVASGWSISGGVATASSPAHGNNLQRTDVQFLAGKTYAVTFTVTSYTSGALTLYANYSTGTNIQVAYSVGVGVGTYTFYWTSPSNGTGFTFQAAAATGYGACVFTIDNATIYQTDADRSFNGKHLIPVGSITKTPVAAGADLVAYSGWSGSSYFEQPYNSAMDFGTGDFSFIGWAKATVGGNVISRDNISSVNGIRLTLFNSSTVRVTVTSVVDRDITYSVLNGAWNFFVLQRRNSVISTYVNGVLIDSFSNTTNLSGTDKKITIGVGADSSSCYALWRVSTTAPSQDQILKMYNDEKMLFQENAKATLYGSSDAVTAVAYDEDTGLLHAGTPSGRSVFNGLRRVENTTTAVSNSISAANGLVAEN